ncbi:formate dehydrogenase accessory sulfurtransferase FdhD [Flavimaricola marinus]|uniref:Sulfur carrier protein FdhD n=1 Tax=Flavimaricola marinus TaxID=1819565 RepID=A0A238LB65_9RHOB|nr:formate dehydrogenase accessory sulfurtransferase FdhD [Flavimaricola marinus]SMY06654.1 formate dehydrogenase accessory protein [Flavimaricola marinus]
MTVHVPERPGVTALAQLSDGRSVALPEEVPVAVVHNGSTLAVMMATPADLVDFAVGFTLTEGVAAFDEMSDIEIVPQENGIEARMWLPEARIEALAARRRAMVGPVGCGLCGIDSLAEAARKVPEVGPGIALTGAQVTEALEALRAFQPLHDETHAVHAAGFYLPDAGADGGIVMAREDVGRHNALDKLIGGLARAGIDPASGAIVLTSRLSVEMVQKAAMAGVGTVLAVSQPTAHAVRLAEGAGMTLATRSRGALNVFTHAHRISGA